MTDQQLAEFVRGSTQAALLAMLIAGSIFAAGAWSILAGRERFVARTKMRLVGTVLAVFALVAGYVVYGVGYVALQAELEYRFTSLRTLCHLPGLLPRILPLFLVGAVLLVFHIRRRRTLARA